MTERSVTEILQDIRKEHAFPRGRNTSTKRLKELQDEMAEASVRETAESHRKEFQLIKS